MPDSESVGYSVRWLMQFRTMLPEQAPSMNLSDAQLRTLSPLALAYLGDAVFELHVRSLHLLPPRQTQTFHRQVVHHVRAEQQAHYCECLKPYLTETELDVLRRGRNAASSRRPRASLQDYQQASALETLIGYLYLTDPQRLLTLLNHLPLQLDTPLP
jgi:ribonuclease-3 family protein